MGQVILSPSFLTDDCHDNSSFEKYIRTFNCVYSFGKTYSFDGKFSDHQQFTELMNYLHTAMAGVVYIDLRWVNAELQWQQVVVPTTKVDDVTLSLQLQTIIPNSERWVLTKNELLL